MRNRGKGVKESQRGVQVMCEGWRGDGWILRKKKGKKRFKVTTGFFASQMIRRNTLQ